MDYRTVLLIVGCYVLVLTIYRELSNHLHTKLDEFSKEFNDFRADVSVSLGEIVGELKHINRGGSDGGDGA